MALSIFFLATILFHRSMDHVEVFARLVGQTYMGEENDMSTRDASKAQFDEEWQSAEDVWY